MCPKPKSQGVEFETGRCGGCHHLGNRHDPEKQNKGRPQPPLNAVSHPSHSLVILKNQPNKQTKNQLSLLRLFHHCSLVLFLVRTDSASVIDFPGALALVGDEKGKEGRNLPVSKRAKYVASGNLEMSCWAILVYTLDCLLPAWLFLCVLAFSEFSTSGSETLEPRISSLHAQSGRYLMFPQPPPYKAPLSLYIVMNATNTWTFSASSHTF